MSQNKDDSAVSAFNDLMEALGLNDESLPPIPEVPPIANSTNKNPLLLRENQIDEDLIKEMEDMLRTTPLLNKSTDYAQSAPIPIQDLTKSPTQDPNLLQNTTDLSKDLEALLRSFDNSKPLPQSDSESSNNSPTQENTEFLSPQFVTFPKEPEESRKYEDLRNTLHKDPAFKEALRDFSSLEDHDEKSKNDIVFNLYKDLYEVTFELIEKHLKKESEISYDLSKSFIESNHIEDFLYDELEAMSKEQIQNSANYQTNSVKEQESPQGDTPETTPSKLIISSLQLNTSKEVTRKTGFQSTLSTIQEDDYEEVGSGSESLEDTSKNPSKEPKPVSNSSPTNPIGGDYSR